MVDQLRNFKDFLLLYNQISDTCFNRCANSFITRKCEPDEEKCVNACAQKFIYTNHRMMETFVETQATIVQKRMDEMNDNQKLLETTDQKQNNSTAEI